MSARPRRFLLYLSVACAALIWCAAAAGQAPRWAVAASHGVQELTGSGDRSVVGWDSRSGLWGGKTAPHWWQSGLAVLTLARYAERTNDLSSRLQRVLERTYELNVSRGGPNKQPNFTDRFMDDTAWWGLAWLAASSYELRYRHDRTDAARFLAVAEADAAYIARQPRVCGGIEWGIGYGPDTISNAEFVALAAQLAQYRQAAGPFHNDARASSWLAGAREVWGWLSESGLIDTEQGQVVADNMDPASCQRRGGSVTYTQGEVAEALVALGQALGDPSYYRLATGFLSYTTNPVSGFVLNDVLQDHCESQSPNCSALPTRLDVTAFKGILVQAFDDFSRTTKSGRFIAFMRSQARAIVSHDILGATSKAPGCRSPHTCQFGFSWARALPSALVTVGTQESALDALTAVLPEKAR